MRFPTAMEYCPFCGSDKTGIILKHTGDDISDMKKAGKYGYFVYYIDFDIDITDDRYCKQCHHTWNHAELDAKEMLEYPSKRESTIQKTSFIKRLFHPRKYRRIF